VRYASGLRRSWRAWLALAVLCGVALSLSLAAGADARRTSSVLDRHLAAFRAPEAAVAIDQSRYPPELVETLLDEVDRLPQVAAAARVQGVFMEVFDAKGGLVPAFDFGSAFGKLVDEDAIHGVGAFDLISGRFPADDQPAEVMMNPEAMAAGGWSIGDRVDAIRMFRTSDFDEQGNADLSKGEQVHVTIVGVAQRPDELIDDTETRIPQVYLFPAFGRAHPNIGFYMIDYIRLVHGAADEAAFQHGAAAVSASSDSNPLQISSMTEALVHADQARRPLVVAVWLLAAVLFAAAIIFCALAIGRSLADHYRDLPVLRALGMSRGALALAITMHAMTIAIVAVVVAMVAAVMTTVATPFGRSGRIEPDPGLDVDTAVLLTGAVIIVVSLSLILLIWGMRTAGRPRNLNVEQVEQVRLRESVGVIGHVRTSPSVGTALRFAFQPPTGGSAGSARMVAGSAALGIALFAGALGFAASLDNVQNTPPAHGWNWDLAVVNNFGTIPDDAVQTVLDASDVDESAAFTTGPVTIAGLQVSALGIDPKAGAVYLTMNSGRAPLAANEIVLGASTLRRVNASVGDPVVVTTPRGQRTMTVVGVATFPAIGSARFGAMSLGDGAATIASVLPPSDPTGRYSGVFLRLVPGSRAKRIDEMRELVAGLGCTDASCFLIDAKPPQLAGYDDVRSIRYPLGLALACLVVLPLGYGIVATVRSRRRELAVLRALGMTQHQVSVVVILYAVVVACLAAVLGLVAGALIANIGWHVFSQSVGFAWPVTVPARAVAFVAVGAVLVATAIATAVSLSPLSRRPGRLN